MKRAIVILLILIISVTCMTTTTVLANTTSNNEIYLLSPIAIECSGDKLLIADNITTSQSAMHIFNTTEATAQFEKTIYFNSNIVKMRCYLGNAYILFADSYAVYDIENDSTTTVEQAIQDIAVYDYNGTEVVYTLVNNNIYRDSFSKGWTADSLLLIDSTLFVCNNTVGTITPIVLTQTPVGLNEIWDGENAYNDTDNQAISMFDCNGDRLFVTSTGITNGTDNIVSSDSVDYACGDNNGNIYILNSKKVEQWNSTDEGYNKSVYFNIGSDTVKIDTTTHDKVNAYTTVATKGYPTNILYRTTGDNSISEALTLTKGEQYTILGYDEDISNSYYYVLYNNQFAWVKRDAGTIAEEETLTIIDNNISGDINYNAKLTSASNVYIYSLPTNNSLKADYLRDTIEQSASNLTEVKLLKSHISSDKTAWYYIEYMGEDEQALYGWVLQGGVGNIVVTATSDSNILLDKDTPHLKVSASLSDNVYIYATENMLDTERLTNPNTSELITLSDNTNVNVIKKTDSATYIQVVIDGTAYYGWVNSDNLISLGEVPMTLIIALSATLLAVALIFVSIKIVKIYRKKNSNEIVEENNN